jgi:hypothetical protein
VTIELPVESAERILRDKIGFIAWMKNGGFDILEVLPAETAEKTLLDTLGGI